MSRLNKVLQQKEEAVAKKKHPKQKKTPMPLYDMSGKTITPEKKKRKTRIAIILLCLTAVLAFIYVPGFLMQGKKNVQSVNSSVKPDTAAIRLSNTALRDNPSEDYDGDGLTNAEESTYETNPWDIDTDGDGATDYCEIHISNTDPNKADNILVDAQTKADNSKEKEVGSPYKIGNVILWADNYTSKAYGSVVETPTGYHFCKFDGYAQFPASDGSYAYKLEDGIRTLLPYRKSENAWKVSAGDIVEVHEKPLDDIVEFNFFSHPVYAPSNLATKILAKILPDRGFITAVKKMRIDIEPDTRDNTLTEIQKPSFDSADDYRFTINSNTLNDLLYVRESIAEDNCCVAVSLFNDEAGEYLAVVYGYTYDGDLLLADMDTLEPIGTLSITEMAKKIMNENGDILSASYFDFSGFGFDSLNGDRISFFAASSGSGKKSHFGEDTEKEDNSNTEDAQKEEESKEDPDNTKTDTPDTDDTAVDSDAEKEPVAEPATDSVASPATPTDIPSEGQVEPQTAE